MKSNVESYIKYLNGNDEGLVEIIRDYKDGLILYLNRFVKNFSIAEDLTQDVFVKLAIKKPNFKEESSFKTWIYKIATNKALDFIKKNRINNFQSIDEYNDIQSSENVERSFLIEERKIVLHKALNSLNDAYYSVLYLSYFENLSNSEIARIMKKNTRQIENLVYRAKLSLKDELLEMGFEYENL